ncbi:MAG: tetratricopeptide repeat protein [Pseudohongiellaceae bacterium]
MKRMRRFAVAVVLATAIVVFGQTGVMAQQDQQEQLDSAIQLFESGNTDEAGMLLQSLAGGPFAAMATAYLGRIHFRQKQWNEAESKLEQALALEPGNANFHYWLGSSYLQHVGEASVLRKRGLALKGRDNLLQAVNIDPGHLDARIALAEFYLGAPQIVGGGRDKGLKEIEAIIALDPVSGRQLEAKFRENGKL